MRNRVLKGIIISVCFSVIFFTQLVNCMDYSYGFKEIGSISGSSEIINAAYVDDSLAFLLEIDRSVFGVYDIRNPRDCTELDTFYLSYMHDIELDKERNLAFVTASNGINILNYSNPSEIDRISVYVNYTSSTYIHLVGERLYVGAEGDGLQIVNVSDPSNPFMIGRWDDSVGHIGPVFVIEDYHYDGSISGNGTGNDVDDFAFVGTRLPNIGAPPTILDMKVLNVTDPTNVTFLRVMNVDEEHIGATPKHLAGDLLFFKHYDFGLRIVNFSDPFNITILGSFHDGGLYNDFKIMEETIALIVDDPFGLKVVNCSDNENLELIKSYEHEWRTIRVAMEQDRIYLATLGGGVRILTIKTRRIPIQTSLILVGLGIGCIFIWTKMKRDIKERD